MPCLFRHPYLASAALNLPVLGSTTAFRTQFPNRRRLKSIYTSEEEKDWMFEYSLSTSYIQFSDFQYENGGYGGCGTYPYLTSLLSTKQNIWSNITLFQTLVFDCCARVKMLIEYKELDPRESGEFIAAHARHVKVPCIQFIFIGIWSKFFNFVSGRHGQVP